MVYIKIPQEQYDKAIGQLKLQLNDVFSPFRIYGLDILIPGAIEEIMELAEKFGQRVRGKDIPIKLKRRRNNN